MTLQINYGFETLSLGENNNQWHVPKAMKEEMQPGDYQMQSGETLVSELPSHIFMYFVLRKREMT